MDKTQQEILKSKLNIVINQEIEEKFQKYENLFLEKNSAINLISKNDANLLFEKHIFDSLAINLFLEKNKKFKPKTLLDIGTGGGFPSVPIAIFYKEIEIYAVDSIRKKINVIEYIKNELDLENIHPTCERVENNQNKYDCITTRAVSKLEKILQYAAPKLNKDGFFVAYKSKKYVDELKEAAPVLKRLGLKLIDTIEYSLPLEETHERNLLVFSKTK